MKFKIKKIRQEVFDTIIFPGPAPISESVFFYNGIYYKVIYVVYEPKKDEGEGSTFYYQDDICGTLTVTEIPEL